MTLLSLPLGAGAPARWPATAPNPIRASVAFDRPFPFLTGAFPLYTRHAAPGRRLHLLHVRADADFEPNPVVRECCHG